MMIAKGTQKIKNIVQDLFELERLINEFKRLKARQAEILRSLGTPSPALVAVESDLYRLRTSICANRSYADHGRFINWN